MERKNKKDKIFNIILQIPYILVIIFSTLLIALGEKINILITGLSVLFLFISGYGLAQNTRRWNTLAFTSVIIFSIWYSIMGYFDYIKWTSTIIGITLLLFYCIIFWLKRK